MKILHNLTNKKSAIFLLFIGFILLFIGSFYSISVGAAKIDIPTVWSALSTYNPDNAQHVIIMDLRLPRTITAILVGAAFAVAGAIMQGVTRNGLADPGILGINAGAAFALAIIFAFFPSITYFQMMLFNFLGAAVSLALTFGVTGLYGRITPLRLVLAGSAVSALFFALSEALAIHFKLAQDLTFWYAGGLIGVKLEQLTIVAPWIIGAVIGAFVLSKSVTILSLGEDVAVGLGERTGRAKLILSIIVLILAGASVSMVGPIGFVGLVVPHIVRAIVGVDYRWIIPCSALMGAVLLLLADIGARTINPPYEIPVGAITALIGVPFFLYIARNVRRDL